MRAICRRRATEVAAFLAILFGLFAMVAVFGTVEEAFAGRIPAQRVVKVWDDEGNEGARPESVYFDLYKWIHSLEYDEETDSYVEVDEERPWCRLELRKDSYNLVFPDGSEYSGADYATYSTDNMWAINFVIPDKLARAEEVDVSEGYEFASSESWEASDGEIPEKYVFDYEPEWISQVFAITNRPVVPEEPKVRLDVKKVWEDDDNAAGKRPDYVWVHLFANGEEIDYVEINADDDWSYAFDALPVFDDEGNEIEYSVSEEDVDGYTCEVGDAVKSEDEEGFPTLSFTIMNKVIPEEPSEEKPIEPETPKPVETPKVAPKKEDLVQTDADVPVGTVFVVGFVGIALAAAQRMRL